MQRLTGESLKVFDLPDDAVKISPFKFGSEFGLLVLTGSGSTVAITKWDIVTNTTSTIQVPDDSEMVAYLYTGRPSATYPPTQQAAQLLLVQARFGYVSS